MNTKASELARLLPGVYYEQFRSADSPLAAILGVAGELFGGLEDKIESVEGYFDPEEAPAGPGSDFVSFLASWVALPVEASWSEGKRRRLVGMAWDLYRRRGTVAGLLRMIRELFEIEVDVEEGQWPDGMTLGVRSSLGLDSHMVDGADGNTCFQIRWKLDSKPPDDLLRRVRAAIDLEKPAHTRCYFLVDLGEVIAPEILPFQVGVSSAIGTFYLE